MTTAAPRPVLADLLPSTRRARGDARPLAAAPSRSVARDAALVIGAALLTALAAQVRIPIPGSPVPITGQTFGVLLTAAALGPVRGTLGQGLYLLLGAVGLPVFTEWSGGLDVLRGPTAGYLVGFVLAAAVVGLASRRGLDRSPLGVLATFVVGNALIYVLGVGWLYASVEGITTLGAAVAAGLTPFLLGDLIKALLAAGLLPAAWRLARR